MVPLWSRIGRTLQYSAPPPRPSPSPATLVVRLALYVFGEGSVFDAGDWPAYVSVVVAGFVGVSVGTWARRFIDSESLLRLLQVIIFVSSALMAGATQDLRVAVAYTCVAAAGLAAFGLGMGCPSLVLRCLPVAAPAPQPRLPSTAPPQAAAATASSTAPVASPAQL